MSILFAGNEMPAFDSIAGTPTTDGGVSDSNYTRNGIRLDNGETIRGTLQSATANLWFHFRTRRDPNAGTNIPRQPFLKFYSGGQSLVQIYSTPRSDNDFGFEVYNGSTFDLVYLAEDAFLAHTPENYDLNIVVHQTTGAIRLYRQGVLVFEETDIDTTAGGSYSNIDSFDIVEPGGQYGAYTEIIAADVPTVNWRLITGVIGADGNHTDWTGAYTDIDNFEFDDGNVITSSTIGNVSTFIPNNINASLENLEVKGVVLNVRGRSSSDDIQGVIRISGTDYNSADLGMDATYGPQRAIWETNPDTSVVFTLSELDEFEVGVEHVA